MEWIDVVSHLNGLAHLATSTADGSPHVSVVMPLVDDDTIWIFTNTSSGKARRIAQNGRIALMWRPGAEAYVYGTAELVHDLVTKQALWARADLPFDPAMFFGAVDNPDHVLVRVTPRRATVMADGGDGIRQLTWSR